MHESLFIVIIKCLQSIYSDQTIFGVTIGT